MAENRRFFDFKPINEARILLPITLSEAKVDSFAINFCVDPITH
jgi:hypothetical protein